MNMLVMSLVSEIVHIPHDSVTLLLLDTSLPSPPLYNALLDISREFHDIFEVSCLKMRGFPRGDQQFSILNTRKYVHWNVDQDLQVN